MTPRQQYAHLTSLLEVPLLNELYRAKIPTAPAAGIMLDLEDTAHPDAKVAAREQLLQVLDNPALFGDRVIVVRVNNLDTPWGRDDLAALAVVRKSLTICYPKTGSAEEIREVVRLSRSAVPERGVMAMIETAASVLELDPIARSPGVVGLHFGYSDYAVDSGSRLYADGGDDLHPALWGVRHQIAMVAAARGLFATGGSMVPHYRDLAKVRTFVTSWADAGYTGILALAPSHLDCITSVFVPQGDVRIRHEAVIEGFEAARAVGRSSFIAEGVIVTEATYRQSLAAIARVRDPSWP